MCAKVLKKVRKKQGGASVPLDPAFQEVLTDAGWRWEPNLGSLEQQPNSQNSGSSLQPPSFVLFPRSVLQPRLDVCKAAVTCVKVLSCQWSLRLKDRAAW